MQNRGKTHETPEQLEPLQTSLDHVTLNLESNHAEAQRGCMIFLLCGDMVSGYGIGIWYRDMVWVGDLGL